MEEVREKLVALSCLKEVERWIKEYQGPPEKLKDYLLERLKKLDLEESLKQVFQTILVETVKD